MPEGEAGAGAQASGLVIGRTLHRGVRMPLLGRIDGSPHGSQDIKMHLERGLHVARRSRVQA